MRKLKLQVQVSIDSFVAGPNGETDWLIWNWDEPLNQYVQGITAPVDCIILGRKLAEGFIPTWTSQLENPDTANDFARKMVETPKVVFTKTITENNWAHTTIENGDLVAKVKQLKQENGGDIIAYGGAEFVSNLIKNNLIDEYHLFINPSALGKGMSIFGALESTFKLHLLDSKKFECGIIVNSYKPDTST